MTRLPALLIMLLQMLVLAASFRDAKVVALLAAAPALTFVWLFWRHPRFLEHWVTSALAFSSALAFALFVGYMFAFTHMGGTAALGFAFWWLVSVLLIPLCIGIARTYHESHIPAHG